MGKNNHLTNKNNNMKKIFSLALGAMMSISAWSYENVPATISWLVGNESAATVTSDAADGVSETKVGLGVGLTVVGTKSNYDANNGNTMVQYQPAESNKGVDASVMIEYRVKMKKGVTFTLTGISYDALKDGTDNASYHWSYAVDGVESEVTAVSKEDLVRNNNTSGTPALNHSHAVTASAGQVVAFRIYVSGFANNKKMAVSNIQLTGTVNGDAETRSFTDFKIEFRDNPCSVILPEGGELPTGVTVSDTTYNGGQHGVQGGTIVVPVDGPVKFTIGACQYSSTNIAIKKNGEAFATISNNAPCGEQKPNYNQFVTWTYNVEGAATLTFELGSQTYVPYFFAEACEFIPSVEVRYYDADGKTMIGEPQVIEGGSALEFAYGAGDVTIAEGKAFRGWFNASVPTATKVAEGIALTEDMNLYAKVTDIEVAELGKIYTYDLTKNYFYEEDHELFSSVGGVYHDAQHGWVFGNGNTLSIEVAGNALLAVGVCKYSATGTTYVKDAAGNTVGQLDVENNVTADGSEQTIRYEGNATKLTFEFTGTNYIHSIKVYNIADFPEKDANTGYYMVAGGDAAGFILALTSAEAGDKIFLPNGIYDLGETCLTTINKNNISIIGQSMTGTIIKNAPDFHLEGLGSSVTLFIPKSVSGTYFQDLTIQNAMDYYAAIAAGLTGGRAAALQDEGTQTVLKNVRLLSYQDTYYSKTAGAKHYFEDCEIHGTVDYICGAASVYFKNNLLYCEKRNLNGNGQDCITAHTGKDASGDKGYVFESCVIASECPTVSLGRAWGDDARTYFLNSIVTYNAGEFSFTGNGVQRWSITGINGNPKEFGEYNTHLVDGTVLTPASNVVTFNKNGETVMETVLSAARAAELTMEYTLGEWAATAAADATQAVCEEQWEDLEPNAIYLAEADGQFVMLLKGSEVMTNLALYNGVVYTLRKANARGGFGLAAGEEPEPSEGVEQVKRSEFSGKMLHNGRVIIVREGRMYDMLGNELVK